MADEAVHVDSDSQVVIERDGGKITVTVDGEEVFTGAFQDVEQVIVDTDTLLNREKQQP